MNSLASLLHEARLTNETGIPALDAACLWSSELLGGEIIRCRHKDRHLARLDIPRVVERLIDGGGAPLIWPRITRAAQDSLDATCRKLHRFLRDSPRANRLA
jgi:hypothetical protein